MTTGGPIQLIAVGFPADARYEGHIAGVLDDLERNGALRIVDVLFVRRSEGGELEALEVGGGSVGDLAAAAQGTGQAPAAALPHADLEDIGSGLEPGQAAGLVLLEHSWARALTDAVARTGGTVLTSDFLTEEAVAEVAADLAARAGNVSPASG